MIEGEKIKCKGLKNIDGVLTQCDVTNTDSCISLVTSDYTRIN